MDSDYVAKFGRGSRLRTRPIPSWRQYAVCGVMMVALIILGGRVVQLHTFLNKSLRSKGEEHYAHRIITAPERGQILDRNGQILSVSTPVGSLTASPGLFCKHQEQWQPMLEIIALSRTYLKENCTRYLNRNFMYIKRGLSPYRVDKVMALNIPGVKVQHEFKRFYPGGPISAHLVGFANIDDWGQEGLEFVHNDELAGKQGSGEVLRARRGHYVEGVKETVPAKHGEDLQISIDQRVQSLASQYLEQAVHQHKADSGSVVVVSVPSGEIISMVTSPQFNPNDRSTIKQSAVRNRAVTDVVEPGSTVKPFTIAMALQDNAYSVDSIVDTSPGKMKIGSSTISDSRDYGEISVFDVLVHSSNIGSAKIALDLPFEKLYQTFENVGFGRVATNFPGESTGVLKQRDKPIEHATMAYGYGLSVTPVQLARAYTVFATDGEVLPVTFQKKPEGFRAQGQRVFDKEVVLAVRQMLEQVATPKGTARKARFARYRVGGKTGTTHQHVNGKYVEDRYMSFFAGMAPITDPRFVMVVTIDNPRGDFYYGGDVAAPVFSKLMADLMRLYNVSPDAVQKDMVAVILNPTRNVL